MNVGAVKAPPFGGAKHANDHDNRSRYRQVGIPGPRRLCRWPGGYPPSVEAAPCPDVLPEASAMPDRHRGLRLVTLLVARAQRTRPHGAIDAAGLRKALR